MSQSYGNKQKYANKNPIQRFLIGRFQDQAAQMVKSIRPQTVLDVGCGEGFMLQALIEREVMADFTGIDQSPLAIAEAKDRLGAKATLHVQDALALASSGKKYDCVMMMEVLEHIEQPERMLPILEQLTRRHVLFSVPWEPFFRGLNFFRGKHIAALGNDPEHINQWSRAGFLRFVERYFRVLNTPLVFPWTMVLAETR